MFHIEDKEMETSFFDDEYYFTILSHHYVEFFYQEMQDLGNTLDITAGGITSIHNVMEHNTDSYDPFKMNIIEMSCDIVCGL